MTTRRRRLARLRRGFAAAASTHFAQSVATPRPRLYQATVRLDAAPECVDVHPNACRIRSLGDAKVLPNLFDTDELAGGADETREETALVAREVPFHAIDDGKLIEQAEGHWSPLEEVRVPRILRRHGACDVRVPAPQHRANPGAEL